jgi:hypothetical protein
MKMHGRVEVKLYAFLTLALDGAEWSASYPCCFTLGDSPGTQWIGGWVDPRASLDMVAKKNILVPARNQTPLAQPIAQSLY